MAVCLCICQLTLAVLTSARFTRCLEGMVCNGCMSVCLSVDAGGVDKCPVYQVFGRHGV